MQRSDATILATALLACLSCVGVACADGALPDADGQAEREQHGEVETRRFMELAGGYRFVSPDGQSARANPYGVNRSGATAELSAGLLGADLKLMVDGLFLHADDYQSSLDLDYSGIVRGSLESRSMFHNLARRGLFAGFTSTAGPGASYLAQPSGDPTALGVASRLDRVDTRIRFGHSPAHLSLGYWRFTQTGYDQLIVADFERTNVAAPPNIFYDVTRRIDQVTQEGRVGLDASLGPLNLAYSFRIRDFANNAPAVTGPFGFAVAVPAESRVTAHTVKLYSNLSGGLTAAAAYSLTQRENTSQRSDQTLSGQPKDTIQQIAGDLAYTPFKELTLVLKYRHRSIERETPTSLSSIYSGTSAVRPAADTTRDTVVLAASWRPDPLLTLRGEYRAELLSRDNVAVPMTAASATQLVTADESLLHTGTLSLLWRPLRAARINASYSYATNSRPASLYDFSERHAAHLLIDWNQGGRWGGTTHYRATADSNPVTSSTAWFATNTLVTPRDGLNQSAGASIWFSPLQRLVLTATYGCVAIDASQAMLLGGGTSSLASRYSSLGHLYGLDAVYAATDRLDLSASLQQVRSRATFQLPAASPDIGSFNRLDATETAAATRIDWRFSRHLGASLDYRFSAYRSDDPQYNGDLHSTTVSLTARW